MNAPIMRVARPVTELARSREMYCRGLDLTEIGSFEDHAGFSGVMLGKPGVPWHLEFTLCSAHPVEPRPSEEDLLVFYLPEKSEWQRICQSMIAAGFTRVTSFNPYWEQQGQTFQDHDGYRTVIQCQQWP
ncbi:VOC family protein [Pantoea sp. BIGb0393]|uniref:VOC family protein n=1 Tax=Pantoea nemavictus TaxID=2726955 RepID=A0ABU8PZN3_9GAMM|nr:VOC family protein [Pantoea nemavictus]MBA0038475.1 VOC family protein [Pantoea nemavictus]